MRKIPYYVTGGCIVLNKTKLTAAKVVNDPTARLIFILGALILATLTGAAPHDLSGA